MSLIYFALSLGAYVLCQNNVSSDLLYEFIKYHDNLKTVSIGKDLLLNILIYSSVVLRYTVESHQFV